MSKQKLFANKTRPKKYIWSKFLKVYRKQKYPEHKQERKNPYK